MSALSRLRGVALLEDGSVDELEAEAEELGWRTVVLDAGEVEDKDAFLEMCDQAFGLPDWFGMNWDALEECLGDLDLGGADGVLVVWLGWGMLAEAEPRSFATALDVLTGAARGWRLDGAAGGVVLLGEGPELDEVDEL